MAAAPSLELRRDVCVASYRCAGLVGARYKLIPAKSLKPSQVWKTYSGLTVFLSAKHGASIDWSNLAHWSSACMFLAAAAIAELPNLGRFGQRLADYAQTALRVALPQVVANQTSCKGGARRSPALMARGRSSEMFGAFALAAAIVVVDALQNGSLLASVPISGASTRTGAPSFPVALQHELLLCGQVAAPPKKYTCFASLVRARWTEETRSRGMNVALEHLILTTDLRLRRLTGSRVHKAIREVVGLPPPAPSSSGVSPRRQVVLLTRRTQSIWVNRQAMVRSMRQTSLFSGADFLDAGDAEDLGLSDEGCYLAAPQVALWSSAWLVVSVVGAHESNVVFMSPDSAGLLESFNCGHNTRTYANLATAAGVPYTPTRESEQQGHGWLTTASQQLVRQACEHLGLPASTCTVDSILSVKPHLYERSNCSGRSARALLWMNMPRMHILTGESADVLRALKARLQGPSDSHGASEALMTPRA